MIGEINETTALLFFPWVFLAPLCALLGVIGLPNTVIKDLYLCGYYNQYRIAMEKTRILLGGGGTGLKLFAVLLLLLGGAIIAASQLGIVPEGVAPTGVLPENFDYPLEIAGGVIALLGIPFLFGGSKPSSVDLTEKGMIMQSPSKKGAAKLPWQEIKSVELKSYLVKVKTRKGIYKYEYTATAEVSKTLKRAIRTFAEHKGIPVYGG